MTEFEALLDPYIQGTRGAWSCAITIGDHEVSGGQFLRKSDARIFLRAKLREFIPDHSILKEYLFFARRVGRR